MHSIKLSGSKDHWTAKSGNTEASGHGPLIAVHELWQKLQEQKRQELLLDKEFETLEGI